MEVSFCMLKTTYNAFGCFRTEGGAADFSMVRLFLRLEENKECHQKTLFVTCIMKTTGTSSTMIVKRFWWLMEQFLP